VASDRDQKIMKAYDAVLALNPDYADRVSYVIAPRARDLHVQVAQPEKHVELTLDALRKWSAQRGK
jgi:peroxiredoxin